MSAYRKQVNFRNIRYVNEDVQKLTDHVLEIFKKTKSDHKSFEVSLATGNEESTTITDTDFQDITELLELKSIKYIKIEFIDYRGGKRIEININHGDSPTKVIVVGKDVDWVVAKISSITTIVQSFTPQERWYRFLVWVCRKMAYASAGLLLILFLAVLLKLAGYESSGSGTTLSGFWLVWLFNEYTFFQYSSILFLAMIPGFVVVQFLDDKLGLDFFDLCPPTELCLGPQHRQLSSRVRKLFWNFVTLVLIPMILSLILINFA